MLESGQHLVIDLYGANRERLLNEKLAQKFLNELPVRIGMKVIREAEIINYVAENPIDSGITGFVILAESHCSIHLFPERDFGYIDVFSCKSFDVDTALEFIKEVYEPEEAPHAVLQRGTGFNKQRPQVDEFSSKDDKTESA